jgi:hypothetical protein
MNANCPLCALDLQKEKIFYEDDSFIVLRTKKSKGHRERIMTLYRRHQPVIPEKEYERALNILSKIEREVFKYTPKFVIVDSTFASINNNWHPVASDLDPKSEDFDRSRLQNGLRLWTTYSLKA